LLDEKTDELDVKIVKEFAKAGYSPSTIRQCAHSLETIHNFIQYVGMHQYYSDLVNRQIFLLGLDVDYAVLSLDQLLLKEKDFVDSVQTALLLKKTPSLDKKQLAEFKQTVSELEKQVLGLNENAKKLIIQIRSEYRQRV
jgi:hypothetical protein